MGSSRCLSSSEEEPLSPVSMLFHQPRMDCYIISTIGCKTSINPTVIKAGLQETLVRHPRFSSKAVDDRCDTTRWVPTVVSIEDHVIVPKLDSNMPYADKFLEDYISNLTRKPMDKSKPLWEVHLLNVKTSDAQAVAVFKIHHTIGDATSLISLLLASTRKSSDPKSPPSIPVMKRANLSHFHGFWWLFLVIFSIMSKMYNTIVDIMVFLATSTFLKDTETPIKGGREIELATKRFVHKTVSLDDIKLIKLAMKMTLNDVLLGITQAALSKYLDRIYAADHKKKKGDNETNDNILGSIRVTATVLVNLRPSAGIQALADMMDEKSKNKWGNKIGNILLPLNIALQNDPLEYLRTVKATIDKKKHSFRALITYLCAKFFIKFLGAKASADLTWKVLQNTTMSISNVVGPSEEVTFYGHPMAYLAPSVFGHPQALTIHFQSYANMMTISLAVDPNVIPDPHRLCDDFVKSLEIIKNTVLEKGA